MSILALLTIATAVLGTPTNAQTPDTTNQVGETITAATLTQQLARLTADSFWNRQTPSTPLERTAQALVAQFQALGLWPGGRPRNGDGLEDTVWIQRYPIPGQPVQLDDARSHLVFFYGPRQGDHAVLDADGRPTLKQMTVPFSAAVRFVVPRVPETPTYWKKMPTAVLLTGQPTTAFLRQIDIVGKAVLYLPPAGMDMTAQQAVVEELYQMARGVLLLAVQDSISFVEAQQSQHSLQLADQYLQSEGDDEPHRWGVAVRAAALGELISMLGVDLKQAMTARMPAVRELPNLLVGLDVQLQQEAKSMPVDSAPNVIGVIAGNGLLRYECIILTAPLDQRGPRPGEADSTTRWTDASTLSLAGLLELARAFQAVRSKRTIVLLAASGGAHDQAFWGSRYYLDRRNESCNRPILNLTLDLSVGGPALGDTIMVAGLDDVTFAQPPAWLPSFHPELGLVVKDAGTAAEPRSDATPFGQQIIPSLLIQRGPITDSAAQGSAVRASELERISRLLQFVFYLSQVSANTTQPPPRFSAVGRQRVFRKP